MKKVLTGNQACAWGVMRCRTQVISTYPITPQTTIIEELAELVDKGLLKAEFIKAESEHSAMAGCIVANAAGARTFTAASSQSLALMHEMLHRAALERAPIVMADVNQAMAFDWNSSTDQSDSLSQRDTGWLQYYCESGQEVLDTVIQAYKVAETVHLPVMLALDAFFLSQTYEAVDIPDQAATDKYLPPCKPELKFDIQNPHILDGMVGIDHYMEYRYKMQVAMDEAISVCAEADAEFGKMFGRMYGLMEMYPASTATLSTPSLLEGGLQSALDSPLVDALGRTEVPPPREFDLILVTSGTITSTARDAVDALREKGVNVGLLKMRLFRPFPVAEVRRALGGKSKVAVIDRNICVGVGGVWAQEIKAALYGLPDSDRPEIVEYIAGLGGRDVTPETVAWIVEDALKRKGGELPVWVALKE